ncbi:four helix bundle protein [Candidatus Parcubacteria bacterium]|nr:four helix bundle protein [Patescibacteria group bacterium]MBU4380928.1 four helix bundle protein [Patescibacteria group bacterium]MCG2689446.1 four helix bundle protein [Candidatus Parcubacteria bacterium]
MGNSKSKTLNPKQYQNTNFPNPKKYDLEERTLKFAKNVREFIKALPKSVSNYEDCKQLSRSSGSIGANYIEANESLSRKDFVMRVKISRKEAKESVFWLNLVDLGDSNKDLNIRREFLVKEAMELTKIFGAIVEKSK